MQLTLFIGDYAYSSWSLRGWLMLDAFGIPFTMRCAHMRTPAFEALRAEMTPSRLVPALAVADGAQCHTMVWETLAIAETVHERHPRAGLWPGGAARMAARMTARSLAAEMHAGFRALRNACPMNMRRSYAGFEADAEVRVDLDRLAEIWAHARSLRAGEGPFMFGAFCAVDAMFAPVASRVATYDLKMGDADMAYVAALLGHASVRRWRAMAIADGHVQPQYELALDERADPCAPALVGRAVESRAAENAICPFTGDAPAYLVDVAGRVLGFADVFVRDKVAADPLAWPEVEALLR